MDSMTCGYLKNRLFSGYLSGLHFDLRLPPGLAREAFPNIQYLFPQEKIYRTRRKTSPFRGRMSKTLRSLGITLKLLRGRYVA